jgi:hypothetical protein
MQARWRNGFKGNRREGTGFRDKLLEECGKDATGDVSPPDVRV